MAGCVCRIREFAPGVYDIEDCDTGDKGVAFDTPGLPLGDCSNPTPEGCYCDSSVEIESGEGQFVLHGPGANVRSASLRKKPEN